MMHCSLLSLGCVFGCAPAQIQSTLSALKALKIAQRRLRPEVRAKLMSVASARSDTSLVPEAWRFVFMDPATSGNCRVVTVAAKASSEHPDTVEAFSNIRDESDQATHPIAQSRLVFDSEQVLAVARDAAKLKGIVSAQYRLMQPRSTQEPVWTLALYGKDEDEPVVQIQVGAKTGTVHLNNGSEMAALAGR
jgi:hypothetical protein